MTTVLGIDLGTTHTVIAAARGGVAEVLADEHGQRLLPSVVSFEPNGTALVGNNAKERRSLSPKETVFSVKRLLGTFWSSPSVQDSRNRFPFELREGPGQTTVVHIQGRDYTIPEISALVLKRARQIAQGALGEDVTQVVLTVPAHFNELQRASTKVAGRMAGLSILRILNEPTAAALAYGLGRQGRERVAVYDLGGGTFDCTILDLNGSVYEVLATAGDTFLGGDDLDLRIAEYMIRHLEKNTRTRWQDDPIVFERIRIASERMKIALSLDPQITIDLRDTLAIRIPTLPFSLARHDLELLAAPLLDRTLATVNDALSMAKLAPSNIDRVVLVGGMTRIPLVRKRVEMFFGQHPLSDLNPDEVVAIGAAIQAAALAEPMKPASVPAPPSFASSSPAGPHPLAPPVFVPRAPAVPFTAPAKMPSIPPPAYSTGATAQTTTQRLEPTQRIQHDAGPNGTLRMVLPESGMGPLLVDVTPRALVVETAGGFSDVLIARNSRVPCERARTFTTARDGQTSVRIRVAQGERQKFGENAFIGELELSALRPAIRGEVRLTVTFELDENGTLKVHARDATTGQQANAVMELAGALTVNQVGALHLRTEQTHVTGRPGAH